MRRLVLNVHMYLLLACSSYLVILGVSVVLFNHGVESEPKVVRWQQPVVIDAGMSSAKQAQAAADGLGLFGWIITWQTHRDAGGTLHAGVGRPGRQYNLTIGPDGIAHVEEKQAGPMGILRFLHGGMWVPGSAIASSWAWYTRLSLIALFLATLSGIYLAVTRSAAGRWGWIALAAVGTGCAGMMLAMVTRA